MSTPQQRRRQRKWRQEVEAKRVAMKRDKYRCQYCGRNHRAANLSVHHILLKSRGGTNELNNLITLCWQSGCRAHDRAHGMVTSEQRNQGQGALGIRYDEAVDSFVFID